MKRKFHGLVLLFPSVGFSEPCVQASLLWVLKVDFLYLLHSVEKREIHCHARVFSSNQFRVKFFSLVSRNFCDKMVAVKFCNFHTVKNSLPPIFDKNFVKEMVLLKKSLNSWFDEFFFQWERISDISTAHCGNFGILLPRFCWKNFVKSIFY